MPDSFLTKLKLFMKRTWPGMPRDKALGYVGTFYDTTFREDKIAGKVKGNHGTYTVSIEVEESTVTAACSCYIGKHGYCHHCEALALAYLEDPSRFQVITPRKREEVQGLSDLHSYLQSMTLDSLLKQLSEKGITQKAFAESIGMNPRHLSAIKSSEARNHYFNELGATKLACLWLLEHSAEFQK